MGSAGVGSRQMLDVKLQDIAGRESTMQHLSFEYWGIWSAPVRICWDGCFAYAGHS
jgi:hypothetical protein